MIQILWWALVAISLIFGLIGCFVNKIPGPLFVVIATLIAILCLDIPISWTTFAVIAVLALASIVLSKILVKLVRKLWEFGKRGSLGTTLGSLAGLLLIGSASQSIDDSSTASLVLITVIGLVILPFVLSFLLELTSRKGAVSALKSAIAATSSYLVDTCLKLAVFIFAIGYIFDFWG